VDRLEAPGWGERWKATAVDDGSLALIHRCEKGGMWEDDVQRQRHAVGLARRPEIQASPFIRRLLDVQETEAEMVGEWTVSGYFAAIWEWADISLADFLNKPPAGLAAAGAQVKENVGAGLRTLHDAGLVHCDVVPNNVLRVDGVWKLADLDSCVERGMPAERGPRNKRYLHPDRRGGVVAARDDFDVFGLDEILARLTS
jgi:serine/threonine protein kinase